MIYYNDIKMEVKMKRNLFLIFLTIFTLYIVVQPINFQTLMLNLKNKNMRAIPISIYSRMSRALYLSRIYMGEIPYDFFVNLAVAIPNLKILDLSYNLLKKLPGSIDKLTELKELDLSHNLLTNIPESITNLKKLRKLNLENNNLEYLPVLIGNLAKLKELNLNNNNLAYLPPSIIHLENLKKIDLRGNPSLRDFSLLTQRGLSIKK